ncbi:MAG: hypothetical protein ACOCVG_04555, partial [Verrucomicrobiota bacterium]
LRPEAGQLFSVFYEEGGARHPATLADYAYFTEGLLAIASKADLFEPGSAATYIDRARELTDEALERFADPAKPGYFLSQPNTLSIGVRKKDWFDNAVPSGNSALLQVLVGLQAIDPQPRYAEAIASLRRGYAGYIERAPNGISHALSAFTQQAVGVAVLKIKNLSDTKVQELCETLRSRPWRRLFVLDASADAAQPNGLQLCVGTQCAAPSKSIRTALKGL